MRKLLVRLLLLLVLLNVAGVVSARVYLVSAGVSDYSKFPGRANNLNLPVKDAKDVADLYASKTSVDYALLLNSEATKSRILKAMKKVFAMAGPNDAVVFYFSGHGYPGGFCAYDGKLSFAEVRKAMALSKCKSKMIFADTCQSGGMRAEAESTNSATAAAKKGSVMLFLSSRTNENSIERPTMSNGLFTAFLLAGLRGSADANGNGRITAKEIFDYVSKKVIEESSGKQHPVMWGNFNNNMIVMTL